MKWLDNLLGRGDKFRPKGDNRFYLELNGKKLPVDPQFEDQCVDLDVNEDRLLDESEFPYMTQNVPFRIDPDRYILEHKYAWTKTPLPELAVYPSFEQHRARLDQLQAEFPDLCQVVILGKTHQGREIPALRVSASQEQKPAVIITGGTHGREWPSTTTPTFIAESLLRGYETDASCQKRLQQGEVWFVPVVNPDGYEHSRNEDLTHRKNMREGGGVDLNRNCDDGKPEHAHLYRPANDRPGRTLDDKGASDNPKYRQYRGPHGASEPETQAVQKLELQPHVRGVLDNHNCGEMLLYPSNGDPALYRQIASKMNEAVGEDPFKVMAANELYPVTGTSNDIQDANGIVGMTLESGLSFQPPKEELDKIHERAKRATISFIDQRLNIV